MSSKHALITLRLGIAFAAFSLPAIGQNDSDVIAEIAGRKITASELRTNKQANYFRLSTNTTWRSATLSINSLMINS